MFIVYVDVDVDHQADTNDNSDAINNSQMRFRCLAFLEQQVEELERAEQDRMEERQVCETKSLPFFWRRGRFVKPVLDFLQNFYLSFGAVAGGLNNSMLGYFLCNDHHDHDHDHDGDHGLPA